MKESLAKPPSRNLAERFKLHILHNYFVRLHMSLILIVAVASGLLASKLLLEGGVHSPRFRYPLAVLASYLAFLLLVRIWVWYVFLRKTVKASSGNVDPTNIDLDVGGSGKPTGEPVGFGGGDFGGGGASDPWGTEVQAAVPPKCSSSGGSEGSGFAFDFGDDGIVLLFLALLVLGISSAAGYMIYAAPDILPEAAWQVLAATAVTRVAKPEEQRHWLRGVLRRSAIPLVIVIILAATLGHVAHGYCPGAVKLAEALRCPEH